MAGWTGWDGWGAETEEAFVIIDCDSCEVRGLQCDDCVVSALLGGPPGEIDDAEAAAFDALAGSGLVPPLRLVVPVEVHRHPPRSDRETRAG